MKLPEPTIKYDIARQRQTIHVLELADADNRKHGKDIEVAPARLILRSPNGTRYSLLVSNTGTLSAVVIP